MSEAVEKISFRQSFWFLPTVYNIAALLGAVVTLAIDYSATKQALLSGLILVKTDLAISILGTLAGAILTMTTITFSMIMVVLVTYSAQFSPRVLQNFIADRMTQHVLAIFSSGFVFSMLTLLFMNQSATGNVIITPAVAVLWGIFAIFTFVYFVHHVATWVQVNNLVGLLVSEAEKTITRVTERDVEEQRGALSEDDSKALAQTEGRSVHAPVSGYITYIDLQALIRLAKQQRAVVQMDVHIGDYVMDGIRMMTVQADGAMNEADYHAHVHFGDEQKDWQDIGFALRKLAEIGMRAVSPSVNDPYTASTCILRMSPLLAMLANRDQRVSAFYDDDDHLRLITRDYGFEDFLHKSWHGIRHYGCSDLIVVTSLLNALALIARSSPAAIHPILWEFGNNAVAMFSQSAVMASDRRLLLSAFEPLAEITGHSDEYQRTEVQQVDSAPES